MYRRSGPSRAVRSATAILMAVALIALSAASVMATGSTKPNILIGSPGSANGALALSPATAGQATTTTIDVKNAGTKKVLETTLKVGTSPASALPAGVTVTLLYGANADKCAIAADARSVTCAYGELLAGASRSVSLVLLVSTAGVTPVEAAVTVKPPASSIKSTFKANGSLDVAAPTCDSTATFLPPNTAGTVGTGSSGCGGGSTTTSTAVAVPALPSGATVQLSEAAEEICTGDLDCFGQVAAANVNDGAPVGLTWTMTWKLSELPHHFWPFTAGVIHFLDDGTPVVIKHYCKNVESGTNCIVSKKLTLKTWSVTVRTPTNGKMRGFG